MPPQRRVSCRQMALLVEFAETHRDVALGRFVGGPLASQSTRHVWDSIAVRLNSIADGTHKTPNQWRRYWIEFKARTKAKAADSRRKANSTGGGPNRLGPLTELEERVLAIIGPVAVEGLPGVRLPIIDQLSVNDAPNSEITAPDPTSPSSTSSTVPRPLAPYLVVEPLEPMVVEWLDEELTEVTTQSDERPAADPAVDRQTRRSVPSSRRPTSQRQNRREERVHAPRWAYNMELRRIANEERNVAALEAIVQLMRELRDSINMYLRQ